MHAVGQGVAKEQQENIELPTCFLSSLLPDLASLSLACSSANLALPVARVPRNSSTCRGWGRETDVVKETQGLAVALAHARPSIKGDGVTPAQGRATMARAAW